MALPPAAARPAAPAYRTDRARLDRRRRSAPPRDRGVRRPPRRRAGDPARRPDRRPGPAAAGAARVRLRAHQPAAVRGARHRAGRRSRSTSAPATPTCSSCRRCCCAPRAASTPRRRPPTGCSRSTPAACATRSRATPRPSWRCSRSGRPATAGARPARPWTRAGRVLGCRHDAEVSAHDLAGLSPVPAAWLTLEMAYFQTWLGEFELAAIHVQDVAMYAQQVDLPLLIRSTLAGRAVLEMVDGAYQSALATADAGPAGRPRRTARTPPARASTWPAAGRCCRSSGSPRPRRRSPGSTRPRAG